MADPDLSEITRRVKDLEDWRHETEKENLEQARDQAAWRARWQIVWGVVAMISITLANDVWDSLKLLWRQD